ncbi:MAG: hypothetical protein AAF581_04400 [Planctomycetota bacterium]
MTDSPESNSQESTGGVSPGAAMAVGVGVGLLLGSAAGIYTDKVGLFLPIGVSVGIAFGVLAMRLKSGSSKQ